ncbi:hypothetical protein HYQ46_009617 [Verticillium longisporum]|nr:hypothetical protein HYQ46_009617 [Verticillium longisporum]
MSMSWVSGGSPGMNLARPIVRGITSFSRLRRLDDDEYRKMLIASMRRLVEKFPGGDDDEYRKMLIASMRRLVEKFPGGYEEWKGKQDDLLINSGYGQGWAASSSEDMPHSWICLHHQVPMPMDERRRPQDVELTGDDLENT